MSLLSSRLKGCRRGVVLSKLQLCFSLPYSISKHSFIYHRYDLSSHHHTESLSCWGGKAGRAGLRAGEGRKKERMFIRVHYKGKHFARCSFTKKVIFRISRKGKNDLTLKPLKTCWPEWQESPNTAIQCYYKPVNY